MSSKNPLDQFIEMLPEGAYKRMRKFCRSLERDTTPDDETLAYFANSFAQILDLLDDDDLKTSELLERLPKALGIHVRKQGKQSHTNPDGTVNLNKLAQSQSALDATAVEDMVLAGSSVQEAIRSVAINGSKSGEVRSENSVKTDEFYSFRKQIKRNRKIFAEISGDSDQLLNQSKNRQQ